MSVTFQKVVDSTLLFLRDRKRAYQLCFSQPAGQMVLTDLVRFCKGVGSVEGVDVHQTYINIGRRQVLERIQYHFHLSDQQLFALYNGSPVPKPQQGDEDDE